MRAGVLPCTALIHECNAGNIISPEACLGAFITCNYAETVPYQLSGKQKKKTRAKARVSVQGVKSLGGHFACLCRRFDFYEVKRKILLCIFRKEKGNTFILLTFTIKVNTIHIC